MKQCILTVGVSGSGKTTWATQFVSGLRGAGENWVNLNRDDIRAEVFKAKTGDPNFTWSKWNRAWEKDAKRLWLDRLQELTKDPSVDGVVISDTNLNPKTRNTLEKTFSAAGFEVKMNFFEVDFETACRRDLNRSAPVGAMVIGDQLHQYWSQFGSSYVPDKSKPKAVIVDIDGTLAHITDRKIFDWNGVHSDAPDILVMPVVIGLHNQGIKVIVVSGRDEVCRETTSKWLTDHLGFMPENLFMRSFKDMRRDSIVKRELFDAYIRDHYHVIGVIDDRPQVITECWLPLGLRVLTAGNPYRWF